MEIVSEVDLLDDHQLDRDLDSYQRLAFGRLRLTEDDLSHHPSSTQRAIQKPKNDITVRYKVIASEYVQYTIQLSSQSRPIITRYSQLESFHRKMIIRHPELAADIPFPRKRFFGNFNSSMLMKRTQQFRSYFLHILNGKNFKYRNSHIFRDFLISDQRQKYRECLVEKNFEAALNYLYPIQDILEELEIVCADHLVTLSLICLCNAKSKQDEAALLYSKKTLSFVTSNSRVISQQLYRPLLQECVSIVAKIKEISEPNKESTTTIEKVEERLSNCVTDRGDAVEDAFEVADTFESIHNSIQTLNSTLSDADS